MGKFWIQNRFIRLIAYNFTPYTQMVYITLCCHAGGRKAITTIGCRKIGKLLSISKNTVYKSEIILEEYGLIERIKNKSSKVSHIKILPVPFEVKKVSHHVGHKEVIKEVIKEGKKESMEHIGSIIQRR